ncbi:MAG: tetratricopeptide repeat protein [Acidobacteria bacterium]|nr:tetratricopeptide repeat protein [Acidobacteriota bacterium]
MKRCTKCNRAESDDSLAYCRADGTLLVSGGNFVSEGAGTLRFGSTPDTGETETRILPTGEEPGRPTAPTTVLEGRRHSGDTRGLSKPKSRRVIVVVAAAILAAAAAMYAYYRLALKSGAAVNSIAVLPFANASGDPNVEYLSDGISESLINSLSQLPGVKVMARGTTFSFKGKDIDPRRVGQELGVDAVLSGRVVQRGDSLTIQTDLVNVSDGSQMWGERYNRTLTDLLEVQKEIARDVLNKLRARLSPAEEQSLSKGSTQNAEAYRLYLTGRYLLNNGTPEGLQRSISYFRQAVDLDPSFALGYAGMADAYTLLGTTAPATMPPRKAMPEARSSAQRALEIDSGLSEAHTSLAWVNYRFDWDWRGAEGEFKRALELNPNNAQAHQWYSDYLLAMGRFDESMAEIKRARELDPLSLFINWSVGRALYFERRYDEALAETLKTLEMNPNFARTYVYLTEIYLLKGREDEALTAYLKLAALTGVSPERVSALKGTYDSAGWKAVWRKELEWALEDSNRRHVPPLNIAVLYSRVGDKDRTLEWLGKSAEERAGTLVYLKVDQRWDFVRSDPRFADLMRRVGLPQ